MTDAPSGRARAVTPGGPPPGLGPYDYADAFSVRLDEPDAQPTEEWLRTGLERAPWLARTFVRLVWRGVLGLRLGPPGSPEHIHGWRIVVRETDMTAVEATSPLLRGLLIAHRVSPTETTLTTYLEYRRPALARAVWTLVGPAHRVLAPILLARAARIVARR